MPRWLPTTLAQSTLKSTSQLSKALRSSVTSSRPHKPGTLQLSVLQLVSTSSVDTLVLTLTVRSSWWDKVLMRFAQVTCSTGMRHQVRNLIRLQGNMWRTFITLIQEEVTGAFLTGDWKVECLSWILRSLKPIGHCLLNGEDPSTRVLRSGGWERPLMGSTCYPARFCGERKKPFLTVLVPKRSLGSRLSRKKQPLWSVIKIWSNHQPNTLTTLLQLRRLTISGKSSQSFTEQSDKQFFLTFGFQSGTRTANPSPDTWTHRLEPWMCTRKSEEGKIGNRLCLFSV